jgi:transmembrane sensor
MSTESTQAIEEAASAWLIRRDSGGWRPPDEARLQEWLKASSFHRVAFWRLEQAWEEAERLKALGAGVEGHQPPPRGQWNLTPFFDSPDQKVRLEDDTAVDVQTDTSSEAPDEKDRVASIGRDVAAAGLVPIRKARLKTHRPRRILVFASAASVLLAVAAGLYVWFNPSGDRYATPVGGLASVPLRDGSNITLNTATEVHVALTGKERDVELAHGEAFFEVAKDAKRPFVVNAGKKRVIAVGTQFSVLRDGDDIRVIVSEGTVRIEDRVARSGAGPQPPALPLTAASSPDAVLLSAGSVAHAGDAGVLVQKETPSETQEQLSWRTGVLMFRDQTLGEAAAEFNRYNERQIVIQDPTIASLKIEGNFRATNVDAFVRLLESGFPVRATESDSQILLTSN